MSGEGFGGPELWESVERNTDSGGVPSSQLTGKFPSSGRKADFELLGCPAARLPPSRGASEGPEGPITCESVDFLDSPLPLEVGIGLVKGSRKGKVFPIGCGIELGGSVVRVRGTKANAWSLEGTAIGTMSSFVTVAVVGSPSPQVNLTHDELVVNGGAIAVTDALDSETASEKVTRLIPSLSWPS